jgi:hypothetical protein
MIYLIEPRLNYFFLIIAVQSWGDAIIRFRTGRRGVPASSPSQAMTRAKKMLKKCEVAHRVWRLAELIWNRLFQDIPSFGLHPLLIRAGFF